MPEAAREPTQTASAEPAPAKAWIDFRLNGAPARIPREAPPSWTLLEHLREERRLMGTKEGCAEGDCGACTVALCAPDATGAPRWRPANACILLAPMLEGRAVVTVEGLAGADGAAHPAQEAFVAAHASQCGFCTPGFVMAAAAARYAQAFDPPGAAAPGLEVSDLIAGNLCRCTGYGPILEATATTLGAELPEADRARRAEDAAWVAAAASEARPLRLEHPEGLALGPTDLDALAAAAAAHPAARLVAGATDVGLWVTKRLERPREMIFLNRVAGLGRIDEEDGALVIGAGATYADAQPTLARLWPDFGELIRRIGAEQVRAAGTIGGNIANGSPIGDAAPALIALGAALRLRAGAARRRLPLEDFFLDYGRQDRAPGEFVEAVEIPLATPPERLRVHKLSKRFDQDISAVCGAFNIAADASGRVRSARIAFGGTAGTPKRARAVEAALIGAPWTRETAAAAQAAFAEDFQPISDMRGSAAYRLAAAAALLERTWLETAGRARTRLTGPAGAAALAAMEAGDA